MPTPRKGEKLLFWMPDKIMAVVCFSVNVRKCNIAHSVDHVELCFQSFFYLLITTFLSFFVAAQGNAFTFMFLIAVRADGN